MLCEENRKSNVDCVSGDCGDMREMEYLQKMAAYQLYPTGITVSEDDELLSLSTCEYSSTNGRLIVLARRIGA